MVVQLTEMGPCNALSLSTTRMCIALIRFRDKKGNIDPRVSQSFTNNLNMDGYERICRQESTYENLEDLERAQVINEYLEEFLGKDSDLDTKMGFIRRYISRIEFLEQYPERVAETYNLNEMIGFLEGFREFCNRNV